MTDAQAFLVTGLRSALAAVGDGNAAVIRGDDPAAHPYLHDRTESRAVGGRADAVALPDSAAGVARTLAWCYHHDVPVIPRGGGSGFAGGAVPRDGGVVLGLERLCAPAQIQPEYWRATVQAGAMTADVRRAARAHGLHFPPDPGSAEISTIGGNVATNAGGPHTFKYGVTGHWVTGLEVALAPGELVTIGGPARKDVAGYDLRSLLIGSEGTLGIVTAAHLKLAPAPEAAFPVMGLYPDARSGAEAIAAAFASGVVPSALEFLDAGALRSSIGALRAVIPDLPDAALRRTAFMVITEADGAAEQARSEAAQLAEFLGVEGVIDVHAPTDAAEVAALWRWREGVSNAVTAQRGGKISEDIVVPVERLADAVAATLELGARHGLDACSWGHAGDGNLHATFMIDASDPAQVRRAEAAAHELFEVAVRLGGSVSGEHGVGFLKNGALALQWPAAALDLHEGIKRLFDPKSLLNPGKKLAR